MNNSNFKETAEKYRNEMMKLYGTKPKPEVINNPVQIPESEPKPENTEPLEQYEQIMDYNAENEEASDYTHDTEDIEKKYPPPEIPVFMQMDSVSTRPQPEAVVSYDDGQTNNNTKMREAEMPDYNIQVPPEHSEVPEQTPPSSNPLENKWGYLKITVRTGSNGIPVPNAAVTISRRYNGNEEIISMSTTDINGDTEIFRLSAPAQGSGNQPQDFNHYSVYDIAVYAKGYYREVSRNVPIFEDITSIQAFNLIPEPYSFDSGGNFISYGNQEPEI